MIVTTYRDTAAHYFLLESSYHHDDNSFTCDVPEEILREYYEKEKFGSDSFEKFMNEEYLSDDMEGLFNFIMNRNGNLDCVTGLE